MEIEVAQGLRRYGAHFADAAVLVVVCLIVAYYGGIIVFDEGSRLPVGLSAMQILPGMTLIYLLVTELTALRGGIGKRIFGLRVLPTESGRTPAQWAGWVLFRLVLKTAALWTTVNMAVKIVTFAVLGAQGIDMDRLVTAVFNQLTMGLIAVNLLFIVICVLRVGPDRLAVHDRLSGSRIVARRIAEAEA